MMGGLYDVVISNGIGNLLSGADATLLSNGQGDTLFGGVSGSTLISTNGSAVASYSATGVVVNLQAGEATYGASLADTLIGINKIALNGSEETLIAGNEGGQIMLASPADNTLVGNGQTKISYVNAQSNIVLDLGAGLAGLNGVNDTLIGVTWAEVDGSNETLTGGNGVDELVSVGNNNIMIAGRGAEYLLSSGYGDTLIGGSGSNTLTETGSGNTLIGGSGESTLTSNGGNLSLIHI